MKLRNPKKTAMYLITLFSFVAIFIFNYFTPFLSDDYGYAAQARTARGLADLIAQEYHQYMTWIGRSVAHLILRISLRLPLLLFKTANSAMFVLLSYLIYLQIPRRKKYDPIVFLLIQLSLWLFTVDFRQTVLWQTGACNYLWTTTIILAMMTTMRRFRGAAVTAVSAGTSAAAPANAPAAVSAGTSVIVPERKGLRRGILLIPLFVFGVVAGWCSENTSGACLVYILLLVIDERVNEKKWFAEGIAGALGTLTGLLFMVLAPGNALRAQVREKGNYTGILGLASRFQKVTLIVCQYFFVLLCVSGILLIVIHLLARKEERRELLYMLRRPLVFLFLFLITAYALILTEPTQPRAYFGAGIFLIIAVLSLVRTALNLEIRTDRSIGVRTVTYSILMVLSLYFVFMYFRCGASNVRIYRDWKERADYIEKQIAEGNDDITVAQVHKDFYNDYSALPEMELTEDPGYWTNVGYEEYYGVSSIRAIPYDDWAVANGLETQAEADYSKKMEEMPDAPFINPVMPGY
ncbi:MAG: DUF6056 family protein [Firmicutes bacterium]|nr:DUF6056 family protein [Bacillota bacterium]